MVVCHQSAMPMRVIGISLTAGGALGMIAAVRVLVSGAFVGGPMVWAIVCALCLVTGPGVFMKAEDDRIVLDATAKVARIIRRGRNGQSTTEIPFDTIADIALEEAVMRSGKYRATVWRVVFVTRDNQRVPWTRVRTNDRASQARAVAAARAIGGWNALKGDVPVVS